MNKCVIIIIASFLFPISMHGQQQQFSLDSIINNAPANVKEYYRVFDSLARPTWQKWLYESWSDNELKKYANLIYGANEYDAIAKRKLDNIRYKATSEAKIGFVVDDGDVINEMKKRFPLKYVQLITKPYWLTIIVEDIESSPYPIKELPGKYLNEIIIHGKVTEVWKGSSFKIGDNVTGYSLWGMMTEIKKGSSCIVALSLVITQGDTGEVFEYGVGGPSTLQRSIFPIDGNYVIDADNLFGLENKVDLRTFTDSLTSTINEIKSWNVNAR